MNDNITVTYDENAPQKIPSIWRDTICQIVEFFKEKKIENLNEIENLEYVSLESAEEILNNIKEYGATLISLPRETWNSSYCLYFGGGWQVFIDLYTKEEGRSDLIMSLVVFEDKNKFIFQLDNIYVP